jgi:hypothetical protein
MLDGLFFRKYFAKLDRLSEFCLESYLNKTHKITSYQLQLSF